MKTIKAILSESLEFGLKCSLLQVTDPYNVKPLSVTDPYTAISVQLLSPTSPAFL